MKKTINEDAEDGNGNLSKKNVCQGVEWTQ